MNSTEGQSPSSGSLGFAAFLRSTVEHSSPVSSTLLASQAGQGPGPSEKGPRLRRSDTFLCSSSWASGASPG
ncbi:hypothetical protein D623_10034029 [Myotis brandtii]|uniref:Uncharacterized protein n=2 Tax=Myotis brandtii TaxID=109478 RepID=S7MQJ7_MYOBR|nr:hypothetical protein D623_10034029 [Myotis brandtii]